MLDTSMIFEPSKTSFAHMKFYFNKNFNKSTTLLQQKHKVKNFNKSTTFKDSGLKWWAYEIL